MEENHYSPGLCPLIMFQQLRKLQFREKHFQTGRIYFCACVFKSFLKFKLIILPTAFLKFIVTMWKMEEKK